MRAKLLAAADYIEAAGRWSGWRRDAPVDALDADRRAAAGRGRPAHGSPNWPTDYGVDVVDRPLAEGAGRAARTDAGPTSGRPTS